MKTRCKLALSTLIASAIVCLILAFCMFGLSSCDDYDPYGTAGRYTDAFKEYIGGEMMPGHTWGFDDRSTRHENVNGNLWYQNWERPVNVTDEERQKVIEAFSRPIYMDNQYNIDYENFWVQQVYMAHTEHTDSAGNTFDASAHMNHLKVWVEENGTCEHVNNFNSGDNQTVYTDDVTGEKFIGTTLMENSFTGAFSYHNSKDSKDHYEYIVLQIDGAYYVGFDFYGVRNHPANANEGVARDYVYNDWIVKITPAYPAPAKQHEGARRVAVEDLLATDFDKTRDSDFDYNDLVFDAVITNYNPWWDAGAHNEAIITVYAAMGTLPVYINGIGQEMHDAFGVPTGQIVDTRNGYYHPITFTITGPAIRSENINDLDVYMVKKNGDIVMLDNNPGYAPVKLCVGTDYDWCDEAQHIKLKYPKFIDWARYGTYGNDDWYKK